MGETEREMCEVIQRVRDMEGRTHLFSFYPEPGSMMSGHPLPSMARYRRIQIARYIIDNRIAHASHFSFGKSGRITNFGMTDHELDDIIDAGEAFRTSGCEGYDGQVACNRPFANSRPGPEMRNYPFKPEEKDIARIKEQLFAGQVF
jgi:biotin synthase